MVEKLRGLSVEVYDSDEWEEKDRADVGGDTGGKGMVAGSTLTPKPSLL